MENFLSPVINKALILTTILLFSQSGWSQHSPFCGTPDLEEIKDQMILNRQELPLVKTRNATTYLPLKAHIVGDSEGNGKINEGDLLEMLCLLNENFADLDIQFYFKDGFNYINNSFIYNNTNPGNSIFRSEVRSIKNKHKAVNVFFKGKVGEEGVLAYYMPSPGVNDFIVVSNSSARNPRVVTHEIGHYFTLLHPFHGWDDDPWDPSVHGNPVGTLAPDNRTINEFADGSNCDPDKNASENNVGDGICDTPADYNFASSSCNYTGDALDPNSEPVSPQVNNWMNYFSGCSNYEFTDGQIKEINRSLNSSSRTDLFSNYSPNIEVPQKLIDRFLHFELDRLMQAYH